MNGPLDARRAADVTIAISHCVEHPPMIEWPDRNLATGACPCCHGRLPDVREGVKAVRILAARRLLRRLGDA